MTLCPLPTPGAVEHCTVVWAVVSEHASAAYAVGLGFVTVGDCRPYDTVTAVPAGPKLVPVMVNDDPPGVWNDDGASVDSDGGAYDDVTDEAALETLPTMTVQ